MFSSAVGFESIVMAVCFLMNKVLHSWGRWCAASPTYDIANAFVVGIAFMRGITFVVVTHRTSWQTLLKHGNKRFSNFNVL